MGQSQAFQTFDKLKAEVNSNPTLLHKVGELAALYQTGDDESATHTSDIIANKLVAGVDPAVAIEETPIPEPEVAFASAQAADEIEPLSASELEVKSLPPSDADATTLAAIQPEAELFDTGKGSIGVVEPKPLVEQPSVQELGEQEGLAFIPGPGLSSQPLPSEEQISSLPPLDMTVDDQPKTSSVPQIELTLNECLVNPGLCPAIEEEPAEEEKEELTPTRTPESEEDVDNQYSDEPEESESSYYYENVGSYQEEEEFEEDEEDYEDVGGYQAAEGDYSKEEESGDEEDDYEEVGGYQEEEEQYSEEDQEEEEDFSEEEVESGDYNDEE